LTGRNALAALLVRCLLAVPAAHAEQEAAWPPIEVAGHSVAPGETARISIDLARALGGTGRMLDVLVVVTRGTRPGPTLCLTAGIHGDELNGVEIAHRIYAGTSGAALAGTLIAVPVVNIRGSAPACRYLPDGRDLSAFPGDADRVWPPASHTCSSGSDPSLRCADRSARIVAPHQPPQIRTDLESPSAVHWP
jgi:predicted deacylase